MKPIIIELSSDLTSLEIVPLADLHLGDPLCDENLIKQKIDYIKENEGVYCLLNGDMINNSTKTSVGDVYMERLTPMEQLEHAMDLLEPIKDKILCITNGNHEARTWRNDGIDLMGLLARQLGLENRYAKESAVVFLRFGKERRRRKKGNSEEIRKNLYTIFVTHGSGGGRKEGAKAIRLADMASIIDADIYIHSHTHLPMVMKEAYHRIDRINNDIALVDKLFVNTSSYLNYGGYGETYEFKPNSKDTPHIFLNGLKKSFKANL